MIGWMAARMVSSICGLSVSLVKTLTPLAMAPVNDAVSIVTWTLPLCPTGTRLSKSTTVQPQAGRTSVISRGAVPSFLIMKS